MDFSTVGLFMLFSVVFKNMQGISAATAATSCQLVPAAGEPKKFVITVEIGTGTYTYVVPCYGTEVFDSQLCKCAEPTATSVPQSTPSTVPQTTAAFVCPFYSDPQNPNYFKFFSIQTGGQFYTYQCDSGKIFDISTCRCVYSIAPTTRPPTTTTTAIPSTFPPGATTSASCNKAPATLASQYYEIQNGIVTLQDCLIGSRFDITLCECVLEVDKQQPKCEPDLYVNFQAGFNDVSGNGVYITNVNLPAPVNGVAQFDGEGYLKVWLYQNAPLGNSITIEVKFQENALSTKKETLVSNCFFIYGSSVEIVVDAVAKQVLFLVLPLGFPKQVVRVPYTQVNVPKTVVLYYDGLSLTGQVDSVSDSVTFQNSTDNTKIDLFVTYGDLTIGTCKTSRRFTGKMHDFAFYKCDKRQWM